MGQQMQRSSKHYWQRERSFSATAITDSTDVSLSKLQEVVIQDREV